MTRKIIFLDVDGTLIDYDNHIPESAVFAIRKAREKGHLVYVCTGRSKAEMPPKIWDIGFDGMIGGNGSYVEHEGGGYSAPTDSARYREKASRLASGSGARVLPRE